MAIAGGGVPAKRVYISRRQLRAQPPYHNVDESAIYSPSQAAEILMEGISCYIESVGNAESELLEILRSLGAIDPPQSSTEWLLEVSGIKVACQNCPYHRQLEDLHQFWPALPDLEGIDRFLEACGPPSSLPEDEGWP